MVPQPKLSAPLPRITRRRVMRHKTVRLATPPEHPLTETQLAERFKDREPNPYNNLVMEHIESARAADQLKALMRV